MDTLDKQHLIRTAVKAKGEAEQCKINIMKSNNLLKEMVGMQYQFQQEMDAHDMTMKVLLLHTHNLISGNDMHHKWNQKQHKLCSKSWVTRKSLMVNQCKCMPCLEIEEAETG